MLSVIKTAQDLATHRRNQGEVGFVATMGNLHSGHISLLKAAFKDFDHVYFSIFVNPTQFGPNEDFHKYPRTLENDVALIEDCLKAHPQKSVTVFAPLNVNEIYPADFKLQISIQDLNKILEGEIRPTHFDGVTTVVYRLFSLIKPSKSYFGLKDFQQYTIIKKMVKDMLLNIEIVGMPIIRETSGLALSSRNQYLSNEQKETALILFNTLTEIKNIIAESRENLPAAQKYIAEKLKDKNWDYLTIRETETLSENLDGKKSLVILSVYRQGQTRLLDNMQMDLK